MKKDFLIHYEGRAKIHILEVNPVKMELKVSGAVMELLLQCKKQFGVNLINWVVPQGHSQAELIVKELILTARGEWKIPFDQSEVCHCRLVSLDKINLAILDGAHDLESVRRVTSASSACGTCHMDVENIIQHRLS